MTVFGESAGGASATYLMMSPLAKGNFEGNSTTQIWKTKTLKIFVSDFFQKNAGLFSKAIAQSGTNLAAWSQPAHKGVARQRATQLAEMFKCDVPNDWTKSIDCLRQVSAENITAAFYDFFVSKMLEWQLKAELPINISFHFCVFLRNGIQIQ